MKTGTLVAIVSSMMVSCMAAELPSPILVLKGTEDYVVRGSAFTRYNLSISNQTAFPDDLFASAPDLPPAGTNINASRTWVNIYEASGRYIYGFAALRSAASLDRLWFAVPKGTEPPDKVYVVLHDRRQNVKLTSNQVRTKAGKAAEEPATPKTSGTVANEGGDVKLTFMPSGAMPKIGYYMPQRLTLTRERPATLRRPPANLVAPLYGVLKFGPRSSPTSFLVVLDEPDDKPARLFVDSNANGDLTDDPPAEWSTRTVSSRDGEARKHYSGGANVTARYESLSLTMHLSMYRFDKNDPSRARLKDIVYYYRDYAYAGDIVLGGKSYRAMLCDEVAAGDFRGNTERQSSGIRLLIDVNDNGKFDRRGESFDVRQPFNIGGTTYEIAGMTAMGDRFQIVKSAQTVAEVPTPPDLNAGKKAVVFSATTTNREKVRFPADYKGKIVLLDFWATWCGPCVAELPKLTAAYEKHHSRGLEVLGISLDSETTQGRLANFTKQNNMPWPQICDGKSWKTEIAQLYAVDSIPRAYLVDGDTGEILAGEGRLRGDALARTIEDELAKKSGAPIQPLTPSQTTEPRASHAAPAATKANNQGDRLSVLSFDPPLPAVCKPGQRLTVRFSYELKSAADCRLFVRPQTNGRPTPGYRAHGSRNWAKGNGQTEGWFYFDSPTRVDQVSLQMTTSKGTQPVLELLVDTDARWGMVEQGVSPPSQPGASPATPAPQQDVKRDGTSMPVPTVKTAEPETDVGNHAAAFVAKTTDGKEVRFPTDYIGSVVLLDFWATWCGPCVSELPNLVAVYEKYHSQGLEVLGISLDNENSQARLADFTKQKNMRWPQVCDGKGWKGSIAQLYAVDSIPRAYLVDGDSGEILAAGRQLRGASLAATIQQVLTKRSR